MRRLAFPLWLVLLSLIAGLVLPWQMGIDLQKNLPTRLERLAENVHAHITLSDYRRGIWQSTVQLHLSSVELREPVLLNVTLLHGPWLGFNQRDTNPWGWSSILIPMPAGGGLSVYPPEASFTWLLQTDLFGRTGLQTINQRLQSSQSLGLLKLQTNKQGELTQCTGELRLPGLQLRVPQGDFILADLSIQSNLHQNGAQIQGDLRIDAQRAAWVMPAFAHRQPSSVLIEQPRITMLLNGETQAHQITLNWQQAQGVGVRTALNPANLIPIDFGRLNARLSWRKVHWNRLFENNSTDTTLLPALNTLKFALGDGVIDLEQFELSSQQGKLLLSARLQGQAHTQDWNNLDFSFNAQADRSWLTQCLLDYGIASSAQDAEQRLAALQVQGFIEAENTVQISTSISLWHGELAISARRFPLSQLLSGTH